FSVLRHSAKTDKTASTCRQILPISVGTGVSVDGRVSSREDQESAKRNQDEQDDSLVFKNTLVALWTILESRVQQPSVTVMRQKGNVYDCPKRG
ncbi:hypothetical protein OS493_023749, partial [Desmophyllum pertusum]